MSYILNDIGLLIKNFDTKLDDVEKSMEENISAVKAEIYHEVEEQHSNWIYNYLQPSGQPWCPHTHSRKATI